MQFQVTDWVILLFGSAKKWDIGAVKLKATTPQGIFFEASCPALMFNRADKQPFTLLQGLDLLRGAGRPLEREELARVHDIRDATEDLGLSALEILKREVLLLCGPDATKFERRFAELYFDRLLTRHRTVRKVWGDNAKRRDELCKALFTALLPIPQAQVYCHDPLQPSAFVPENNFRVDFAFWTGLGFHAVEIDGREPGGYADDVRKDRLLRRAGVDVIHVLNTEIMEHSDKVISALLPAEILESDKRDAGYAPLLFDDDLPF
jgi:hypothetical protein